MRQNDSALEFQDWVFCVYEFSGVWFIVLINRDNNGILKEIALECCCDFYLYMHPHP